MSEKRFEIRKNINGEYWLFDNKYDKAMMISKIHATLLDVCNMLNEQQAEIERLKKELDNFKPVMFQDVRKGTVILYSKGDIDE